MRFNSLLSFSSYAAFMLTLSLSAQAQAETLNFPSDTNALPAPNAPTDASLCATSEDYLRCLADIAILEIPECSALPDSMKCFSAREKRALALDRVGERTGEMLCIPSGWSVCFVNEFSDTEMAADPEKADYGVTYRYLGRTPNSLAAIVQMRAYEVANTLIVATSPRFYNVFLNFSSDPSMQMSFSQDTRWMLAIGTSNGSEGDEHKTYMTMYDFMPPPIDPQALSLTLEISTPRCGTMKQGPCEFNAGGLETLPLSNNAQPTLTPIFGCVLYEQQAGNKTYHVSWQGSERVEIHGPSPSQTVLTLQYIGDKWQIIGGQIERPDSEADDDMRGAYVYCSDMIQAPIGSATMLPYGTLVLDLIAQSPKGSTGYVQF